jgi:hypothetical protein
MDPDDVPTLQSNDGILKYCHEIGAVGITPWRVRTALESREIIPHRIGNQLWFSRNAVHRWLDSLQDSSPPRPPRNKGPRRKITAASK